MAKMDETRGASARELYLKHRKSNIAPMRTPLGYLAESAQLEAIRNAEASERGTKKR